MRRMRVAGRVLSCVAVALALGLSASGAEPDLDGAAVGRQGDGRIVVPTNQVLDPAGFQVEFPGRPTDLALSPDGSLLAALNSNALVLIRVSDRAIMQTLPVPKGGHTFVGIVWAADGGAIFTSGTQGAVHRVVIEERVARFGEPIVLPGPGGQGNPLPGGLALSQDGATLYVCLNRNNTLGVVDAASGELMAEIPVGVAPYGVVAAGDAAYVTNWGGRHPVEGDATAASSGTPIVVDPSTGIAASGMVSVVDLAQQTEVAQIEVGLHPCGLALNREASRLFVANANSDTVSVVDTASRKVVETIDVAPAEVLPFGSAPNAVALSPDGRTLYVANGGNNAIAVVRLGAVAGGPDAEETSRVEGFIPTGWYPGSVRLSADGKTVFVANVKGVGSLNAPTGRARHLERVRQYHGLEKDAVSKPSEYVLRQVYDALGSVSVIPAPDAARLEAYTKRVADNNRLAFAVRGLRPGRPSRKPVPVPLHVGEKSVFEHVIDIIKENRTYDQILGDMPEGNGDPALVHFGEEVTPNHHRLAREFVLLDNFYCSGVNSADGHQWTDEAYVTDYLEKSFGGFERSYPYWGGDPLAYASSGFLWDNALRHGKTLRDYGEFVRAEIDPSGASWADIYADYVNGTNEVKIRARPGVETLEPYLCPTYVGFPGKVQDVYRAREFIKELRQFEASGELPNLIMMLLPNDHTVGTRPGYPTPRATVADNDLALGQIVEAVSHSVFWPKTCIFVVEDDPQAGLDHVDGHRTVAFVISPYTKRGAVDSTNYNQTGMVRTIELILGLPPMNQFDLSATPMASCFTDTADLKPYTAVPNRIPLDEMNPPLNALSGPQRYWAMKSLDLPLDDIDQADEHTFNQILWHSVKGYDTPYPRLAAARP
ncbi:MAG: beta-propeller fold lactonase family protein [Armatimonadota bacterium]|nr:MAG: beta-propeller fold lactonase family protein [Armatimonadota bacterium]